MGKIIAGIIIVLAIIGGGLYLKKSQNKPPAIPGQGQIEVIYADSGFSPKEINIKVGQTVTWKNENTAKLMWIASAPHPVHTDYPEFDAKKAMSQGETYSFTFGKPGNWKYHNHINPTDFGVVNVAQ